MALERGPLLLLTLSLGLASAQKTLEELPVQPGFDAQKVQGRWLTIQLAASHAHLVSPADPLRLALHSIWTWDGDLQFVLFWTNKKPPIPGSHPLAPPATSRHPVGLPSSLRLGDPAEPGELRSLCGHQGREGVCRGVNVTVHLAGPQGQYQGSCEGASPHTRPLVSTNCSSLILYVRFQDGGETTSLWALLARRMLRDPEGLEKYLEDVAEFQLQKAPVFNLDGKRCPQPFPLAPRQAGPRSGASSFGPGTPTASPSLTHGLKDTLDGEEGTAQAQAGEDRRSERKSFLRTSKPNQKSITDTP
ncbi:beta-lactoglobulin [Diceros bicornis minor]|uniref:beta-lactoglobulin n=1 Tax=Diceros bicornis minor TaxID=77932 RepID=UPI0026F36B57|nr:beta-lactoglobulin [Diceros bicornis minor]